MKLPYRFFDSLEKIRTITPICTEVVPWASPTLRLFRQTTLAYLPSESSPLYFSKRTNDPGKECYAYRDDPETGQPWDWLLPIHRNIPVSVRETPLGHNAILEAGDSLRDAKICAAVGGLWSCGRSLTNSMTLPMNQNRREAYEGLVNLRSKG